MPLTNDRSDSDLMTAVQQGDTGALDALYLRHHARLFSFLARWTGNAAAAEDLVQDAFLRLLRHPDRYLHQGDFIAWLYRIARNLAIDAYRHTLDEDSMDLQPELADQSPLALDRLTREEREQLLDRSLRSLPLAHREVLLLRGVDGLDHRNIALVLNCTEGAARVRVHRATAALRRIVNATTGEKLA